MATSANLQMPVLFDITPANSMELFGEVTSGDVITNHLEFVLDRTASFATNGGTGSEDKTLAQVFNETFMIGDAVDDTSDVFYVNMIDNLGTATADYASGRLDPDNVDATAAAVISKLDVNSTAVQVQAVATQRVDIFCNKLADAILKPNNSKGPQNVPVAAKRIPLGGKALVDGAVQEYSPSIAPSAAEEVTFGGLMARVAACHLVGHPLSHAIFSNEDDIQAELTADPSNIPELKSELAAQFSKILGGSAETTATNGTLTNTLHAGNSFGNVTHFVKSNFAANPSANVFMPTNFHDAGVDANKPGHDLVGVAKTEGRANAALKSIYEQLIGVSGRAALLNDDRQEGYTITHAGNNDGSEGDPYTDAAVFTNVPAKCVPASFNLSAPTGAVDKLCIFLRPKLLLGFEATATGAANALIQHITEAGVVAEIAVDDVLNGGGANDHTVANAFPGYGTAVVGNAATADVFGWMGSVNSNATTLRTTSQTTTDVVTVGAMDQHVWKFTITL
jgi:hypothetical protein